MKRVISFLISIIMLVSSVSVPYFAQAGTTPTDDPNISILTLKNVKFCQTEARKMLAMVNDFRASKDNWQWKIDSSGREYKYTPSGALPALAYDYQLEKSAMLRAAEIAYEYSHTRPNGEICFSAIEGGYYALGENIAYGYGSAKDVFEAWQETNYSYSGQGHRRNMLSNDFTAVAFGCVQLGGRYYWVQEFKAPVSSAEYVAPNDSTMDYDIEIYGEERHSYMINQMRLEPTCGKAGKEMSYICCYCGEIIGGEAIKPTGNHSYKSKVTKAPTTKSAGELTKTCTVCGKKAKKSIAKLSPTSVSKLTPVSKGFKVSWKKAKDISGYKIQYSTTKGFEKPKTVTVKGTKTTSKTIKKLGGKKRYYVRICTYRTINGKNYCSSWSKKSKVTTKK